MMTGADNKAVWPGWETVRLLGRGSFGAVYEIEREVFGHKEKAALKLISIPQNRNDIDELYTNGYDDQSITALLQEFLADIVREYALMAEMKGHTNVVCCDDVRTLQHEDGLGWDIYIKMELLTPLLKALPGSEEEEQIVRIGRDLCQALVLCRSRNIIHRDIKPQNIFVSPDGDYKLGDFGIAKTVEKTSGGTRIGTYNYMAPEVYNNQPYGHAADIYSLGLVLYWLLNERRLPFYPLPPAVPKNADMEKARERRFSGEPLPAPAHGSESLKRIVLKACAFDPRDRYQHAEDMLRDLERLKGQGAAEEILPRASVGAPPPTRNSRASGPRHAAKSRRRRKRPLAWLGVIAVLILAVGAIVFLLGRANARGSEKHGESAAAADAVVPSSEPTPAPPPTPEPTPEPPLTASVSTSASSGRTQIAAVLADASSFLNSKHIGEAGVTIRYPSCAIDGNTKSSWQEAADGAGAGEWLRIDLEREGPVRYLSLWLGNWESAGMYGQNGRPSKLELEFSDGSSVVCSFPDEMKEYEVRLSKSVMTSYVKLTILEARAGTKWADTCISEIKVYSADTEANTAVPTPTPVPTPEPTPTPVPTPTPGKPPVVTKQPANVTVYAGGSASFTARAINATEITWYIAGPEGKTGYPASEIGYYIKGVYCTGCNEETLTVYNLSLEADGWKAVCRFTNADGKSYTTAAIIRVK